MSKRNIKIKPIETEYAGYKFRSRLEARWAVFFDALGLKWQYEPEGYVLEDGIYYLPDFYVEDLDMFFEIKGQEPTEEEKKKCEFLTKGLGKESAILGNILNPYEFLNISYWVDGFMEENNEDVYFIRIANDGILEKGNYPLPYVFDIKEYRYCNNDFMNALWKARSARFEHGERG